jgi:hypothetical protein
MGRDSMHGDVTLIVVYVYAIDCVIDLSSSDVSEHVKVWCYTLFSRLVARVQVAATVAGAAPCSLASH